MDRREYVITRRKRYLAKTMEEFEAKVETLLTELSPSELDQVASFKATVRRHLQAFETDVLDVMGEDPAVQINAMATAVRDRL